MKVITRWAHIEALKGIVSDSLLDELKEYLKHLVVEMLEEEAYETLDIFESEVGKIAILEEDDDIEHLPDIGMTTATTTLLEFLPEFVDLLNLGEEVFVRVTIICGDSYGVVLYIPKDLVTGELESWIKKHKGDEITWV